jgi:hypothetical protein
MKHFAVELKRNSYITVHVDAETKEQAEAAAWLKIEQDVADISDADWECTDIYEQFATDESRSNGPHQ